ncbi:MAG: heparan-alpha-glucosaminide N-acetyltransferase domain-containing protein [Candidatus Krumholzibacteriia bacterium]
MRLRSLDLLRGLAVIGMILVNNPGADADAPVQLRHAGWTGITFADTVAPAFMWVVGFAMALSFARRRAAAGGPGTVRRHVVRRALTLMLIGVGLKLGLALVPDFDPARLAGLEAMGILQRIAVAYAVGAFVLLAGWPAGRTAVALMAGSTAVMLVGAGTWSAAVAFGPHTNLALRLDTLLLGGHASRAHSLLSILPAAATVLLGAAMARAALDGDGIRVTRRIVLVHALLPLLTGGLLGLVVPVSRYLWSPSFALLTAGLSAAALLLLQRAPGPAAGGRWLAPVVAVGANPLLLFVLSEAGRIVLSAFGTAGADGRWRSLWQLGFEALAGRLPATTASVVFSVGYLTVFVALAMVLARRGVYVKL